MFPCVKGQAPELHGPVDGGDGYCKGFPAPDLFWRPALLKPGLEQGLQCLVLQPESLPAALAAQTIELVCLVGTAGAPDGIAPKLSADRRRASVQGSGNLADSAALSTKTQYTFPFCCCKMRATHRCQSPSLFMLAKLILANNCYLWALYLLSTPPVAFRL